MNNLLVVGVIFITFFILLLSIICIRTSKTKEQFKLAGFKNKRVCRNYFLNKYVECMNNSGNVDFQGQCWHRTYPYLISCNYNDY